MEQDRSDMELLDNAFQHSKDSSSIPQTLFLLLYLCTLLLFPITFYLFTFLPFYPYQLPFTFLLFYPFTLSNCLLPLYLFTLLPLIPSFYLFTLLHLYLLNKIGPVVKMPRPVRVTLKTAIDSRQYFMMKTFVLL